MVFQISLIAVAVLLLSAVPGYLMIKRKMISEDCISGCSKILLYVSQPALAVYTFRSTSFSVEKLINMGIFALLALLITVLIMGGSYLALRKRCDKPIYRIITVATTFSNCAFFAIPVIEALFPTQASDMMIYTTVFAVAMNIIGWTAGAAVISQDVRYVSLKKVFLNPATVGLAVAMLLFVTQLPMHPTLDSMITTTARMATPLSMLIMGMRLATVPLRSLFTDLKVYATIAVNQIIMPLVSFLILMLIPLPFEIKVTFFIICASPVASVVLNFAEIVGEGQKEAANMVLLGTALSVVTLPIMMLLLPLMGVTV